MSLQLGAPQHELRRNGHGCLAQCGGSERSAVRAGHSLHRSCSLLSSVRALVQCAARRVHHSVWQMSNLFGSTQRRQTLLCRYASGLGKLDGAMQQRWTLCCRRVQASSFCEGIFNRISTENNQDDRTQKVCSSCITRLQWNCHPSFQVARLPYPFWIYVINLHPESSNCKFDL